MDHTQREITKIAREADKFTLQMMKQTGIGTAEFDVIHFIRHHPGATQTQMREALNMDKGAAARRVARLESKGYLTRSPNPSDGRSQLLYPTDKAETLRNSKAKIESVFYAWLLEELPEEESAAFCKTLDTLYHRSKAQSRAGFTEVSRLVAAQEVPDEA